jgi:hypothetical protein
MRYDKNLLSAIVCIAPPGENKIFRKYRNIKDAPHQLDKLEKFARTIPYADHINLYYKATREFKKQIKL